MVHAVREMGNRKIRAGGSLLKNHFLRNGEKKGERSETISQFIPVIYSQTTANDDRDWPTANPTFDGISHVDVLDW